MSNISFVVKKTSAPPAPVGVLTYIDTDFQGGSYYGVGGDDTFIYAMCYNDGLRSYSVV